MKKISQTFLVTASSIGLISCVSPQSTDPVGDAFTNASNAIGNVVNRVVPPTPAQRPAPPQQTPVPSRTIPAQQ